MTSWLFRRRGFGFLGPRFSSRRRTRLVTGVLAGFLRACQPRWLLWRSHEVLSALRHLLWEVHDSQFTPSHDYYHYQESVLITRQIIITKQCIYPNPQPLEWG